MGYRFDGGIPGLDGSTPTNGQVVSVGQSQGYQVSPWLRGRVMVLGIALIALVLSAAFAEGFDFVSEETTVTRPPRGDEVTETTKYSTDVVVLGVGAGTLLILLGAFINRIRSVRFAGIDMGFVDELASAARDAARRETERNDELSTEERALAVQLSADRAELEVRRMLTRPAPAPAQLALHGPPLPVQTIATVSDVESVGAEAARSVAESLIQSRQPQ